MSVIEKFNLSNKVIIVTGAAQGLGKAMALALAECGAKVILADKNLELAMKTANEMGAKGLATFSEYVDVVNPVDVNRLVENTIKLHGQVDILVNNAGIANHDPAEDLKLEDWRQVIDVNLTGVFLCAQAAGRTMIKQGSGNIINIASMSGLIVNRPQPQSVYNVSKAGVIMLTKCLAAEWAQYGIRVNAIAPGYMSTPLTWDLLNDPKLGGEWLRETPQGRAGEPEELGGSVVYLASDASTFMTGQVLVLDGGYTCW